MDERADLLISGKAGEVLEKVDELIKIKNPD